MKDTDITVIIPARDEEQTIEQVVNIVKKNEKVKQIIVVNNNSSDNTVKYAEKAGADVIHCIKQGKGYAMEEGMKYAQNDIIVFIDADIENYSEDIVKKLTDPLVNNEADFVKSSFVRTEGGLVTEIAVKPLLNIFFPDMYKFSEPISGMIAGKKDILDKLEFEKDYGVDIGILLDILKNKNRVVEVNIGKIKNMSHLSKTKHTMGAMSTEIIRAIVKRVNFTQIQQ